MLAMTALAISGRRRNAESAAERAVKEAQKYKGQTITIVWEAGLQALDPLNYSGPKWEELTGIKVKVVEVPTAEMFTKIMQEYRAGTGAYDALNVIPAWMPDLAKAGALEVLDPYVEKYGYRDELQTIAPTYRDNQMKVNDKIYGFPDDGDVFVFYYRKDIFEDPKIQEEFKAKLNRELAAAEDLEGVRRDRPVPDRQICSPHVRGGLLPPASLCPVHVPGALPQRGRQVLRCRHHEGDDQQRYRRQGVHRHAQREQVHAAGRRTVGLHREPGRLPGRPDRDDHLVAALRAAGPRATARTRRRSTGCRNRRSPARSATPCRRAAIPSLPRASRLSVASTSKNKDAAYLFIQWLNSEDIDPQRVQAADCAARPLPGSALHRPGLSQAVAGGQGIPRSARGRLGRPGFSTSRSCRPTNMRRCCARRSARLWAGEDPKAILDEAARQWDAITEKIGVDKQKAVYANWATKSGAYPK